MNVGMQWMNIEKEMKRMKSNDPRFDAQTIDFEAEIDSTLSYPENLNNIKRKYNLHEETTEGEYKDRISKEQMIMPSREREGYHPRENKYAGKSMSDIVFMKHQSGETQRYAPATQQRSAIEQKIRFFDNSPVGQRIGTRINVRQINPNYQKESKRYAQPIGPTNAPQRYSQPIGPQQPQRYTQPIGPQRPSRTQEYAARGYQAVKSIGYGASKVYRAAERGYNNPIHIKVPGLKKFDKKLRIW